MGESSELKETILAVASDLFAENGYAATSIKQIAQAAGCTNAALYYYFEGGKEHILREVVQSYSMDTLSAVDEINGFDDFSTYLQHLSRRIGQTMPRMSRRLSWLVFELPTLPEEERDQFADHFLGLQRAIRGRLERYFENTEQASNLAWVIVCAFFGYGQLFHNLGFEDPSAPSLDAFGQIVMSLVGQEGDKEIQ
jgi:AcrR family transcriptional regulator